MTSPAVQPAVSATPGVVKLPAVMVVRFPHQPPSIVVILFIVCMAVAVPWIVLAVGRVLGTTPFIGYTFAGLLGVGTLALIGWRGSAEFSSLTARARLRQAGLSSNPEQLCRWILQSERWWAAPTMGVDAGRIDQLERDLACRLPRVWIDGEATLQGIRDPGSLPQPRGKLTLVPRHVVTTREGFPAYAVTRRGTILGQGAKLVGWAGAAIVVIAVALVAGALVSGLGLPIVPSHAIGASIAIPIVGVASFIGRRLGGSGRVLVCNSSGASLGRRRGSDVEEETQLDSRRTRLFVTCRGIMPNAMGHVPGLVATHIVAPETRGELVIFDVDFRRTAWKAVLAGTSTRG